MKLKVLSNYQNRDVSFAKGSVIEVDTEYARFLMTDAPGCFEEFSKKLDDQPVSVIPEVKAIEQPPKTTMVKRAKRTK